MSSANPLSMPPNPASPASSAEKKIYEPSMEEILASIRRIIADDQSLPGRGPVNEAFASPLTPRTEPVLPPAEALPAAPAEATQAAAGSEPEVSVAAPQVAHGAVAAPQFASPHAVDEPHRYEATAAMPVPVNETVAASPAFGTHVPQYQPGQDQLPQAPADAASDTHPAPAQPKPAPESLETQAEAPDETFYDTPILPPEPEPEVATHDLSMDAPEAFTVGQDQPPAADAGAGLFSAATDSSVASAFNMLAASRLADNSDELMNLAREMIRPLLRTWIDDNLPSMVERMVRAEIERVARGGR